MKYTIEYNDCAATRNRMPYGNNIYADELFLDSDLEAFQYAVAIQADETSYQDYLYDEFDPVETIEEAKAALDDYDSGFGNPVVFRISKEDVVIYEDNPEYWSQCR